MRFAFIIQGEGRGHISQAIAMKELLEANDHILDLVFIGTSNERELPGYFHAHFSQNVFPFQSPNFRYDKQNKRIRIFKSMVISIIRGLSYIRSIRLINREIIKHDVDCVINFCDLVGGLVCFFCMNKKIKKMAIAHHYYYHHPEYKFPRKRLVERLLFILHNKVSMLGMDKILALSYQPMKAYKKMVCVPPLIREEIKNGRPEKGNFILVYTLNPGYLNEIQLIDNELVVVFSEGAGSIPGSRNKQFYNFDDKKFVQNLFQCRLYLSSAGFESVCEANYLQKDVHLVPTINHFEQYCNALDAESKGLGTIQEKYHKPVCSAVNQNNKASKQIFKEWADCADEIILKEISNLFNH